MTLDRIRERLLRLRGGLKEGWVKLTAAAGNASGRGGRLLGRFQDRYNSLKCEAEEQVEEWLAKLPPPRKR